MFFPSKFDPATGVKAMPSCAKTQRKSHYGQRFESKAIMRKDSQIMCKDCTRKTRKQIMCKDSNHAQRLHGIMNTSWASAQEFSGSKRTVAEHAYFNGLKYLCPVIWVKIKRLPGNTKNQLFTRSWTARVRLVHSWAETPRHYAQRGCSKPIMREDSILYLRPWVDSILQFGW